MNPWRHRASWAVLIRFGNLETARGSRIIHKWRAFSRLSLALALSRHWVAGMEGFEPANVDSGKCAEMPLNSRQNLAWPRNV